MYQVFLSKSAAKAGKKQGKAFVTKIGIILTQLSKNPMPKQAERLSGEFNFLYSYHFTNNGTAFRLSYKVDEDVKKITVVLIGPRENFYKTLKQKLSF
ncbi:type II toxin-antitoxin system RelE/ParE family toxin [Candidatus Gottesmanbacteria bacterium]|nr:type II toxin-antitoxin system RelE/ParE family toxin [Candidatus Gottesmanbacteria bacterium]